MKLKNTKKRQCWKLLLNTFPLPKTKKCQLPYGDNNNWLQQLWLLLLLPLLNYQVIRAMGTGKKVPAQKATVQKSVTPPNTQKGQNIPAQ